jgi:UDP-N-acetylmuramate--alanine ligase
MGATVWEGHSGEQIAGADVVVCSSAVRGDNPEVVAARQRQIPVIPRAEMLAELMRLYRHGIAVAGTHGKTTTTSMVAHLMTAGGFDPAVVVGGRVAALGSNARLGRGEYIVVEADESDGSLLLLTPTIAVLTNIDTDHTDFFSGGIEQIKHYFSTFANRVPFYGTIVLCLDDQNVQEIIPTITRRTVSYGLAAQADVSAWHIQLDSDFGSSFSVRAFGQELGRIHEVRRDSRGPQRVPRRRAEVSDQGRAGRGPGGRRLRPPPDRDQGDARGSPHRGAVLLVTDIYAASEDPIEGVTSAALAEAIKRYGHRHAEYIGPLSNAAARLKEVVKPSDLVLTLGAGNVWQAGDELLKIL